MAQENITPLARQLAEENGLDWRKITGSGPGGLILEGDVLEYLAHQLTSSTSPATAEPSSPPSFEIDLTPQPPAPRGLGVTWPAEPPANDQPLVWGKLPEAPIVSTPPPLPAEETPQPPTVPVLPLGAEPPLTPVVVPAPPSMPVAASVEVAIVPPSVVAPVVPLPDWQPITLRQRWISLDNAHQAALALSQAWQTPVGLHHLLLRAAQLAGHATGTEAQVLWGQPEGDRLLAYPLPAVQALRDWTVQLASSPASPVPCQPGDWVVICLDEAAPDLVSGPGHLVLCLGSSREGWAPLACTGPWPSETAQALLEAVEYYLKQPVLLV